MENINNCGNAVTVKVVQTILENLNLKNNLTPIKMDKENKVVEPQPEGGVSPEVEPLSTVSPETVPPEVLAQIELEADAEAPIADAEVDEGPDMIQEEIDSPTGL